MEVKLNFTHWPMTMFGQNKLSDVGGHEVIIILFVIIGAVQKHYKISILLDRAGFTEVR